MYKLIDYRNNLRVITTRKKSRKHYCGKRLCRLQNANYFVIPHGDMSQGDCSYCLSHHSTCNLEYDPCKTKVFANHSKVTESRTFKKRFRFAYLSKNSALKTKHAENTLKIRHIKLITNTEFMHVYIYIYILGQNSMYKKQIRKMQFVLQHD